MSRRNFLKTSVTTIAAVAGTQSFAQEVSPSNKTIAEVEALVAKKDIESTAKWDDGLVHPAPYRNPYAQGKDRGLVLGGGGGQISCIASLLKRPHSTLPAKYLYEEIQGNH